MNLVGGQSQGQAGNAAGGGSHYVVGLPGSPAGAAETGGQEGTPQGQGHAIDQGFAYAQDAYRESRENGFLQPLVLSFDQDGDACSHLPCPRHGQDGQEKGDAVA